MRDRSPLIQDTHTHRLLAEIEALAWLQAQIAVFTVEDNSNEAASSKILATITAAYVAKKSSIEQAISPNF
jgi:hypothetical protein